jgi:hypothetical protein
MCIKNDYIYVVYPKHLEWLQDVYFLRAEIIYRRGIDIW